MKENYLTPKQQAFSMKRDYLTPKQQAFMEWLKERNFQANPPRSIADLARCYGVSPHVMQYLMRECECKGYLNYQCKTQHWIELRLTD